MRPAVDPCQPGAIADQTLYLREQYITRSAQTARAADHYDNQGLRRTEVSRLLIVMNKCGSPTRIQKSWHHEGHRKWAIQLARELTTDARFERTPTLLSFSSHPP